MNKIYVVTIDEEFEKAQVKGFIRTKKGKMERVNPFERNLSQVVRGTGKTGHEIIQGLRRQIKSGKLLADEAVSMLAEKFNIKENEAEDMLYSKRTRTRKGKMERVKGHSRIERIKKQIEQEERKATLFDEKAHRVSREMRAAEKRKEYDYSEDLSNDAKRLSSLAEDHWEKVDNLKRELKSKGGSK